MKQFRPRGTIKCKWAEKFTRAMNLIATEEREPKNEVEEYLHSEDSRVEIEIG